MEGQPYQLFINLPFGELMAEQTGTGYQSPYKFNGKLQRSENPDASGELDPETGLYYYGARYYDPQSSTWLSVDPLADVGAEYSPYCYTFINPIKLTDPDGRWPSPLFGFRLGFNIGFSNTGLNFKLTASAGLESKGQNYQAVAFASASIYSGQQLGTSSLFKGLQYDLKVGAYASLGSGTGSDHNFYTLNYHTPSPFNKTFDLSLTYGQMLTFNSAINVDGDGPGIQSEGLIGMRLGENFSLSSNNDAETYGSYLMFNGNKNHTDAGWTGGIVLNVAGVEAGYQNFSGYWPEFTNPKCSYGYVFTAENWMKTGQNGKYHQSLNRAFNFVRKSNVSGGVYTGAWFQNAIHRYFSNNGTYNYND